MITKLPCRASKKSVWLIFPLCVFFLNTLYAQRNTVPLERYLVLLEEKYNIRFSYRVSALESLRVEPKAFGTLTETINYLEAATPLAFEIAEDRYVIITPVDITTPVLLNEVVISNYLIRGINKNSNGMFVLNNQKGQTMPGLVEPDVLQMVQALPGIESANETISNINIRGGSHDQNLILWNGIKMYHTGHFFGLISAFNPYVTNYSEIVKNGASAHYGDAVSGIINMQSKPDNNTRFKAGAGMNLLSADAFVTYNPNKKLTVQCSARHSITDIITSPVLDAYLKRTLENTAFNKTEETSVPSDKKFQFYDFTGTLAYTFKKKHSVRTDFLRSADDLNYHEVSTDNFKNSLLSQTSQGARIVLESNWSRQLKTVAETYISSYDLYGKSSNLAKNQLLIQENSVLETGLKTSATRYLNQMSVTGGYQFVESGVNNGVDVSNPFYLKKVKQVMRVHSAFAEGTYQKNRTHLRLGTRVNYFGKLHKTTLEPRINLNQYLSNSLSLKLLGELRSQSTTQIIELQQDFFGIEKRRWVLANGNTIPVIKSRQLSLGADYKKGQWLVSGEAFYKYADGITTQTQGFNNQIAYINAHGSYTVKGLEFLINRQTEHFNSWVSYTFSKNYYEFKSLSPPEFPNNTDIRHSLDAAVSYSLKRVSVSAGYKFRTGAPYTTPETGNEINSGTLPHTINYNNPNRETLKNYARIDVSCSYHFLNKHKVSGNFTVALLNVFNTRNILNTYYELNANETEVVRVNNYSLGFAPNASLRFSF